MTSFSGWNGTGYSCTWILLLDLWIPGVGLSWNSEIKMICVFFFIVLVNHFITLVVAESEQRRKSGLPSLVS